MGQRTMNTMVDYDSKFGNTERIARAVGAALESFGPVEVRSMAEKATLPAGLDLLLVGGPTQAHGVDQSLKTFLDGLPRRR
jgi:flavodoxin